MIQTTRAWLQGLRDFAIDHRRRRPLGGATADAAWSAERSILGATLATRLAEIDAISAARGPLGSAADPAPAVVVTTSAAGIAAADDLLATSGDLAAVVGDRLAAVTELEYRLWCIRNPDDGFIHHLTLWNWIKTALPAQRRAEFSRHPLGSGESYWLHRTGLAGAGDRDRRDCHLWRWNGRHASLLQPFVAERGVREIGADGPAE